MPDKELIEKIEQAQNALAELLFYKYTHKHHKELISRTVHDLEQIKGIIKWRYKDEAKKSNNGGNNLAV